MAVPPRNRKAGKIEIDNKERELKEKAKKNNKKTEVTSEEHEKRLNILKDMGILK